VKRRWKEWREEGEQGKDKIKKNKRLFERTPRHKKIHC
jgi:hypothetical protein